MEYSVMMMRSLMYDQAVKVKNLSMPLSLYIHIPWCIKKCPYCDFNSYALNTALPESEYIDALIEDLKTDLPYIQNRPIESIFFGGGTPSLFSPKSIDQILSAVSALTHLSAACEVTLEANPGTLEYKNFKDYRLAGINRVSLGAQSFQDSKLKSLGRIHQSKEIKEALNSLIKANFNSFNIDLMYGLPEQTLDDLVFDLESALAFNPPHLSWYNLNIEPNTIFYHKPPILPDPDLLWTMHEIGEKILEDGGLVRYEVSAFAKPGFECKHNLNYWTFGDYVGIGAGAHGKITNLSINTITRYTKKRYPKSYLEKVHSFIAEEKIIAPKDVLFEFMLNALRLKQGFTIETLEERTGITFSSIQPQLEKLFKEGLLYYSKRDKIMSPTPMGYRFLNNLVSTFLPEE